MIPCTPASTPFGDKGNTKLVFILLNNSNLQDTKKYEATTQPQHSDVALMRLRCTLSYVSISIPNNYSTFKTVCQFEKDATIQPEMTSPPYA